MKYENEVLRRMIEETCDPDEDMRENLTIEEIAPSTYHIQYIVDDPCYCVDFKVKVTELVHDCEYIHHFNVYDSVYADDGDFFLDYHLVANK